MIHDMNAAILLVGRSSRSVGFDGNLFSAGSMLELLSSLAIFSSPFARVVRACCVVHASMH